MLSTTKVPLPSILIFGPQGKFPSEKDLEDCRHELITNTKLSALRDAVDQLPQFWQDLVGFDPSLQNVPGDKYLASLRNWLANGGSFPHSETTANHYGLAATALLQTTQYFRYLRALGEGAHCRVLDSVQNGGVQGFCVGFLNAAAVASSTDEGVLSASVGVALRLAMCIGAYVDADGEYAGDSEQYTAVSVRWRDGNSKDLEKVTDIIRSIPHAYISSLNDESSVTVTLRTSSLGVLAGEAHRNNLRTKDVHVRGRFHNADHSSAVDKIMAFSKLTHGLAFPDSPRLQAPIRNTADGKVISNGSLTRIALESAMVNVADWSSTIRSAFQQLPKSARTVTVAGFGSGVPASLTAGTNLQVLSLAALGEPTPKPNGSITNGTHVNGINGTSSKGAESETADPLPEYPPHSIAIVGMAGRFPGADSVDELWDLLMQSKTMVQPAPVDRLGLPQTGDHANTKWWGNFLNDPEAFDHKFFKKSSREALAWDPQQRILLEVVYEALESSGYFGASASAEPLDYGCYIGAVMNNYYDNLSCHAGTAYATVGTSRCYLSGCMSHYFGWTGPSLTIDTACSSSLVAINTACRAIWSGECSRAVAGGTNVISSPFDYQNLSAAGFLSPSGQCKPFDAGADGYCRGEGVSVVVLKPLADAVANGDDILGVIVGSAANQNHNVGQITAPHSASQVELYQKVLGLAGVEPGDVSYVEAHGTGTGVGDPIEVASIRDAFGVNRDSVLHFSSIKGNIGHTEATAGVAGLVKVLLMMRHREIPAQASYNSLNPKIPPFDQTTMVIPRQIVPWKAPTLLSLVNSYGAAGSNSAVLVREGPSSTRTERPARLSKYPLLLAAGSPNSISAYSQKLLDWLAKAKLGPRSDLLPSLAFHLADRGNHKLPHILATSVESLDDLEAKLASAVTGAHLTTCPTPKPVVLVFGGQESDRIGISEDFYRSCKVFRMNLDAVDALCLECGHESIFPAVFESSPPGNLITLHSALFAVQYASAKSWMDCGLNVDAVVGHSFGQLTALCISGVLSLSDALKLVSGRASLMQRHWGPEPGSMLFMQADRKTVQDLLARLGGGQYAEIACFNGPKNHVVVGSSTAVDSLQQYISSSPQLSASVRTKKLNVTNGFHSQFTEPLLPHLTALAKELVFRPPKIYLETTNELAGIAEPDFTMISEHTRRPVFFQNAIQRLATRFSQCTWIEAGLGSSVIQLVKASVPDSQGHAFYSPPLTSANAMDKLTDVTVDLWNNGYATQYWPFHRSERQSYEYLSLPPIQFEKTRHFLAFKARGVEKADQEAPSDSKEEFHDLLGFLHFKDSVKKEAVFRIDPQADRFKKMLGGHVMGDQSLAPASLYFEVVARAALLLQNDSKAEIYMPCVDDLHMRSPIGQDINTEITLVLTKLGDVERPEWSFRFTTRPCDAPHVEEFEVSTGRVCLQLRDNQQQARDFERYETLTGHRRYEQVVTHPDAEKMQGKHIYRAFNTVVFYDTPFHGIKEVACVGFEAAGKVRARPDPDDPADQRLVDTPMTDSFMQFAGFLVNYFNNPSTEDVLVCGKIDHIELGGSFDPDAGEWLVYATMSEGGETEARADAYVFDARTKKMVMAAFGFRFSKMSRTLLGRILKSVNKSANASKTTKPAEDRPAGNLLPGDHTQPSMSTPRSNQPTGKRRELLQVLSNVTDIPVEELKDEATLDDLGIDSLMATEVLNDIRTSLGLTIDLSSFLFFQNLREMVTYVDEKLGTSGSTDDEPDTPTPDTGSATPDAKPPPVCSIKEEIPLQETPTIVSVYKAFQETRLNYDRHAKATGADNFWKSAYSPQARLVRAYIVEAFADLGCDIRKLKAGAVLPPVNALGKHAQLTRQFHRALQDGGLITESSSGSFIRADHAVDPTPAEQIYREIIDLHPQHASVLKLVRAVGSEMAACLSGRKEGIQVVFGNRETKKTLEDMYEFWPLLRTPSLVLGDFLGTAFRNATGRGKFRILEIGAGTGGTTRHILQHLRGLGVDFEYVFTDLGASLVNAAAKGFKDHHREGGGGDLLFDVLDLEKEPKEEYKGRFHAVIATNCVHATRDLAVSLRHARQMLRDDGVLALIEITQNMYWLDIVVGLFEGWWLFEDGRQHALVDERHWEKTMKQAGFGSVSWSDGKCPEAKLVRVIAAFPGNDSEEVKSMPEKQVKAGMETVVYKSVGDLDILADVYYPLAGEELPRRGKVPVALMIHGGSHMLFSRKDVRPAQTRLLLNRGFLPVSIDYRLCPEVSLLDGPMVDACDAFEWTRTALPKLRLPNPDLQIDGETVAVVGWSSGGQLAMSLGWTAPQRGLPPPAAMIVFYAPTDYEDAWWQSPIMPNGAPYRGQQYDVLDGVRDAPIAQYDMVGAWEEPIADPRSWGDSRCRIVMHINWKAQTLPVILTGLPSKKKALAAAASQDGRDWGKLPQPPLDVIRSASPRAHIRDGSFSVPTFFVHGTADDLIPWEQTEGSHRAMAEQGLDTDLALLHGAPHICDLSSDPASEGWKAVLRAYDFLTSRV